MTEEAPTRTGALLAATVAVGVAVLLGASAGYPIPTAVGVAGACLGGAGLRLVESDADDRRAAGSVAVTLGLLLVAAGVALAVPNVARTAPGVPTSPPGAPILVALAVGGVFAVAATAAVGAHPTARPGVRAVRYRSGGVLVAGVLLVGLAAVSLRALAASVATAVAAAVAGTVYGAVFWLQVLGLAVLLLLDAAAPTLRRWLPPERGRPVALAAEWGRSRSEIPRLVLVLLGIQLFLFLLTGIGDVLLRAFLALLPVVGEATRLLLLSGALQAVLGLAAALLAVVVVADFCRAVAVSKLSPDPPGTLAPAAGGVFAVVAVALVDWVLPVPPGSAAAVLFGLALLLAATWLIAFADSVLVAAGAPPRGTWFAYGAGLLFAATVVAAARDVAPIVTVVGVVGAVTTWDLGRHATDLGEQLGSDAETNGVEVVHATATAFVGLAATGVAALALYVVVPPSVPGGREGGFLALLLVLVSVAAFQRSF